MPDGSSGKKKGGRPPRKIQDYKKYCSVTHVARNIFCVTCWTWCCGYCVRDHRCQDVILG